ncbi:MAG: GAP family protein [Thiohalocapsa sp.]
MIETLGILIPFLIADVLNPVLFAFMVYAVGTPRPVLTSSAMLLGHTAAYFGAGIVIALGLETITRYLANPSTIDYLIALVLGLLLLWVALLAAKKPEAKRPEESGSMTPLSAFGMGAVINFIGIPFALPYFAAIDQVLKANLSTGDSLVLLVAYNLVYALPFLIVPILVTTLGERARPLLQKINATLDRASAVLMPVLLGLAGLALVADALLYFATGKGLF